MYDCRHVACLLYATQDGSTLQCCRYVVGTVRGRRPSWLGIGTDVLAVVQDVDGQAIDVLGVGLVVCACRVLVVGHGVA